MNISPGVEGSPELGITIRFGERPGFLIGIDEGDSPSALIENALQLIANGLRNRSKHVSNTCHVCVSVTVIWPALQGLHQNEAEVQSGIISQITAQGGQCHYSGSAIVARPPEGNGWKDFIRAYDKKGVHG